MQTNASHAIWLDDSQYVTIDELIVASGLTEVDVIELIDAGVLAPTNPEDATWTFSAKWIVTMRKAMRLREDFELDIHALALALQLLDQIRMLESELSQLRAQQPSFRRF